MNEKEKRPLSVTESIAKTAEELYGSEMYMTSAAVPETKKDPVEPPSTQNEADSREWTMEHQV